MISKCLSALLLVSAISCGHLGFRTVVPVQQQFVLPIQARVPVQHFAQIGGIHPIAGIPARIGSSLPVTNFQVIPKTIPQYLLSFPRTANFEIPHSVPIQLLSIAAPRSVAPLAVQTVQTLPSLQTFKSPAEKIRSEPNPAISSASVETPLPKQTAELPQTSEMGSLPKVDSNVYSGSQSLSSDNQRISNAFSTPLKPLNFAPNLPEVNKPLTPNSEQISPSVETTRDQKIPEQPIQPFKLETPEIRPESTPNLPQLPAVSQQQDNRAQPINSAPQPLAQQNIDSNPQSLSQQRIDSAPQPLSQQRIDAIPQNINNGQLGTTSQLSPQRPSMLLSSYSF